MISIIPSILTSNSQEAFDIIKKCEEVLDENAKRLINRISIDIIDGKYAHNKTVDPIVFENIQTDLLVDFHLMVNEPINWVEKCVRAGADRIIGQVEKMENQIDFIGKVQEVGLSVGLALDLETPVETISSETLKTLDIVLLMSVPAGFGGQDFDGSVLQKVKTLNKIRKKDKTPFKIHVDGGVDGDVLPILNKEGVDEVSMGKRVTGGNIYNNIKKYTKIINGIK